jgi:hypothetical protein
LPNIKTIPIFALNKSQELVTVYTATGSFFIVYLSNNGIPHLASQSDGGRLNPINNSFERIRSTKY